MTIVETLAPVAPSSAATKRRNAALSVIGAFCVVAAMLALVRGAVDDPPQTGPSGSSFATTSGGVAALADLARGNGFRVERATTRLHDNLKLIPASGAALVVLGTQLEREDVEAVLQWTRDGGRLIADVTPGASWPQNTFEDAFGWQASLAGDGPTVVDVVDPQAGGARKLAVFGTGSFQIVVGGQSLATDADGASIGVRSSYGIGEVILLADSSMLTNALLAQQDNAGFGLSLFEGRPRIVFAEEGHGYGSDALTPTGLPWRGRWFAFGLLFATLLLMWSRSKRLGRPEPLARELAPPRSDYLDAMVASLSDRRHRNAAAPASPAPAPAHPAPAPPDPQHPRTPT